tara:strand:+ start:95 stop:391 length:297 start_codon:yes stop_codon:yes gene_type:complete
MSKAVSVVIKKSTKPEKKLMAVFKMDTGRTRTTHFGQAGAPDYTRTRDKEQKSRYLSRHRRRENWDDATSAGALSRWILWDLPTRRASIASYKKRFNL